MRGTALRHIASALARLREGGRLVAIVGANCAPEAAAFRDGFVRLQEQATILFSAAIAGKIYAKHGTTTATRLLVKIGRASCRERVGQSVYNPVVAVSLKKKKKNKEETIYSK